MKKIYQLIPILVLLFTSLHSQANRVVGADVSYTCTSTPGVYKVTLKVYRNCAEANLCTGCSNPTPNGNTTGCTTSSAGFSTPIAGVDSPFAGQSFGNYTLAAVSGADGYDIVQTCYAPTGTPKTICTNCNTRTAGTVSPGIELYIFEGNVNLTALPSACCKVALGFSICCRNGALTHFTPGNFYTEAIVDRCVTPCNGAPIFTNNAAVVACQGIDFVYNLGAIDPDGDSLSYALGESYQGQGTAVPWNPPFNASYPFGYLGAPNASAPYPAGLRVDPITGDVIFRPQGVFVSNLVIEVKQWKLVGSVRVNVGTTRRDVQFQTALCANNLPPRIKIYRSGVSQTGQEFSVCAGQQICLDIVAEDQRQTSPSVIIADTTNLTWNNPGQFNPAMANATWVANYIVSQRQIQGPKADSFKFCWTPPVSAARDMPHTFTVKGVDWFCPIAASVTRAINIKVIDIPRPIISSVDNLCGNRTLRFQLSNPQSNTLNPSASQWQIEQTPGTGTFVNIAAPTIAGGGANNGQINYRFVPGGTYKVRLKLNSTLPSPNGCPSLDSVFIINKEPLKVTVANSYNCIGSPVTMKAQASGGNRVGNAAYYEFFSGLGFTNSIKGAPLGSSVDSTLTVSPTNVGSNTTYKVKVKDHDGCTDSTTFNVFTRALPIRELTPKIRLCGGEDTALFAGNNGDTLALKTYWYNENNPSLLLDSQARFAIKKVKFSDSTTYFLRKTDIYGCSVMDTSRLFINEPVQFNTRQDSACAGSISFPLRGLMSTMYIDSFVWYNINTGNRILENDTLLQPTNNAGIFRYKLRAYSQYDGKTCYADDTAVFKVNALPVIANRPTPVPLCQNYGLYDLGTVATSTPATTQTSQVWTYPPNPNAFPIASNKNIISIDSLKYLPTPTNWVGRAFGNYAYLEVKSNLTGCIRRDSILLGIFPQNPINLATPSKFCDFDAKYSLYNMSRLINAAGSNENWMGNGVTYDAGINRWFFNPSDTPKIVAGNNIGGKVRAGLTNITDSNILRYTFNRQFPANIQAGFNLIPARAPINMASPVEGCASSDTVILRVRKSPKLRAGILPTLCVGNDSVFLSSRAVPGTNSTTAANPATSYWYFAAPNTHLKAIVRGQVFVPFHSSIVIANGAQKTYKLYYGDTATGCNVIDTANLNVKGLPAVDISLSNIKDSAVCLTNNNVPLLLTPNPVFLNTPQDSFTLTGAPGLVANYGQANGLFNFIATGVQENTYKLKYYYRAPEGKGCHNSDSINVRVQFPPKVNLGPDAAACEYGAEFTINVADPPSWFAKHPYGLKWEVVNQSGTILKETIDKLIYKASAAEIAAGTVMVRVVTTNPGSCPIPAADTAIFTIFKKPLADFSGFTNGYVSPGKPFNVTYTAAPSGMPNCNYVWFVNNVLVIDSIEKTTFNTSFTTAGAYKTRLVVIHKMTSCSDTSDNKTTNVWNVGVQNININTALSVYPNPSKTLITISNKTRNLAGKEYRISNLVGQTLLSGKLGIEETQVNIESLSSGVYLLSIEGMSSQSIKLLKE